MSFYPKLTLSAVAISKDEPFTVYGTEDVAAENQVHIRLVNREKTLANLRCTPAEAREYAQKIIDAATSLIEKED